MDFPNLFSPLTLRGHYYRNRILTGPTLFAEFIFNPELSENVYRMLEGRAKGGAAEVTTGELNLGNNNVVSMFNIDLDIDSLEGLEFEAFCEYPRRIKKHGAVALLEICHSGGVPAEYSAWQMNDICSVFTRAARFARAAGFDGVLLHGGHGFLIQQFVSTFFNTRTDQYGGSAENRARFPMRLLEALREGLGEDGILELRISAEDGEPDGMTIDDTTDFARRIDGKVDIMHISNGQKSKGNRSYTFTDMYDAHGHNIQYAAAVKAAVKKSRVAVIGGLNSPELCEQAISGGKCDFVILSRQAFADPNFANKAQSGQQQLIRRCVRCFQCYPGPKEHETEERWSPVVGQNPPGGVGGPPPWRERPYTEEDDPLAAMLDSVWGGGLNVGNCAINPSSNLKIYPELFPAPKAARRVLVVGGGVAGMQAALTAGERGHTVTLAERGDELGGVLRFTDNDDDKRDLYCFKETLKRQLLASGASVLLKQTVDAGFISAGGYDYVLLATGARPRPAAIKGAELAIDVLQACMHSDKLGHSVIIVGSGLSGCEAAVRFAGMDRRVSVIARRGRLAPEATAMQRTALLDEMDKRGVIQLLGHKTLEIFADGVLLETAAGETKRLYADSIVTALGTESDRELCAPLADYCEKAGIPCCAVGDCEKAGNVGSATSSGYIRAMLIR